MNIKIADFGYARYYMNSESDKIRYNNSDLVGSAKCNAPELMNNDDNG
jgi:hypothetical protein